MPDRFIVSLKPDGALCPLVCVFCDEVGRMLPERVEPERPVVAFKHLGHDGKRIRLTTVEAIAEQFNHELLTVRPDGPFILAGFSFGGIVAHEMAAQLRKRGHAVPLVILIDTYAPQLHEDAMNQGHHFYSTLKEQVLRTMVEQRLSKGQRLTGRLNHYHIVETYSNAISSYSPQPNSGRMLVIRAAKGWGPVDLGWYGLSNGGFVLREIPCKHDQIVKPPFAEELASTICSGLSLAGC